MKLPLVLASLFVGTTAYAQAPGEYDEGSGAPGMADQPFLSFESEQRRVDFRLGQLEILR
jgi:hypothetical protein